MCIRDSSIICHPYFLSKGRHVREDIPNLISEAKSEFPFIKVKVTEPLGVQDGILNLIDNTIKSV